MGFRMTTLRRMSDNSVCWALVEKEHNQYVPNNHAPIIDSLPRTAKNIARDKAWLEKPGGGTGSDLPLRSPLIPVPRWDPGRPNR